MPETPPVVAPAVKSDRKVKGRPAGPSRPSVVCNGANRPMTDHLHESILKSLRRITRSIDLHSRELASRFGLTGPQLVCLRAISHRGETTPSKLAKEVALSQATITGIIDRLTARQLVTRERSETDRRLVTVKATTAGKNLVKSAPYPLQESFLIQLSKSPPEAQERIRNTLDEIVHMMNGDKLDAAPVLSTSPAALSPEEISEAPEGGLPDNVPLEAEPSETPALGEAPLEPTNK